MGGNPLATKFTGEEDGDDSDVSTFGDEDVTTADTKERPRVLLLPFEHCAGFNFQHVSRDVIIYSPLWLNDEGVAATALQIDEPSYDQRCVP